MKRPSPLCSLVRFNPDPVSEDNVGPRHFPVVLYFADGSFPSVVVAISYMDSEFGKMIGVEPMSKMDEDGSALVRVPLHYIDYWLTDEESASIHDAYDIDQAMLCNAR